MITVIISPEARDLASNKIYVKDKKDINHLKNVFRVKARDTIRATDGVCEYICIAESVGDGQIILNIMSQSDDTYNWNIELTMGISCIKNDKMDMVVQKLTELGIDTMIPLMTQRTIIKLDSDKISKKLEKWDVIARETLKQCQGIRSPRFENIKKLADIDYSIYDMVLVPYEDEKTVYIRDVLRETAAKHLEIRKILAIIGPEGGFEPSEISYLKDKGAHVVSLGKRILRAETAAIVTGGILLNEFL